MRCQPPTQAVHRNLPPLTLRFDVPVQHIVLVHVVDREGDLDEPVHDLVLLEELALGCRDARSEVAPVTVRHDDAEVVLSICEEAVLIRDDVGVSQALHELHFTVTGLLFLGGHALEFDYFEDIGFRLGHVTNEVDLHMLLWSTPPTVSRLLD